MPVGTFNWRQFISILIVGSAVVIAMAGHADANQRKANSPGHFHIKDRKSNRNAEAAIKHIVEERIARIVIVFAVAAEFRLFEHDVV